MSACRREDFDVFNGGDCANVNDFVDCSQERSEVFLKSNVSQKGSSRRKVKNASVGPLRVNLRSRGMNSNTDVIKEVFYDDVLLLIDKVFLLRFNCYVYRWIQEYSIRLLSASVILLKDWRVILKEEDHSRLKIYNAVLEELLYELKFHRDRISLGSPYNSIMVNSWRRAEGIRNWAASCIVCCALSLNVGHCRLSTIFKSLNDIAPLTLLRSKLFRPFFRSIVPDIMLREFTEDGLVNELPKGLC
ncbi:16828_t:CDS:2, partial [Dentiscutata heterogama]